MNDYFEIPIEDGPLLAALQGRAFETYLDELGGELIEMFDNPHLVPSDISAEGRYAATWQLVEAIRDEPQDLVHELAATLRECYGADLLPEDIEVFIHALYIHVSDSSEYFEANGHVLPWENFRDTVWECL